MGYQLMGAKVRRLLIGAALALVLLPSLAVANERFSGFYGDPAHDGEGFVVEVLADGNALVYWFTYDEQGNQRWMYGVGTIDEDGITIDHWVSPRGGRFGNAFDPSNVTWPVIGSGELRWIGCDQVAATYVINGVAGSQQLARASALPGSECGLDDGHHRSAISGTFVDAQRNGEGLIIQALGGRLFLVLWFTFDATGEQMWLMDIVDVEGDVLVANNVVRPTGGLFGTNFDPATVVRNPWGKLEIDLTCAALGFKPTALDSAFVSGRLNYQRLSTYMGPVCDAGAFYEIEPVACGDQARTELQLANFPNQQRLVYRHFMPSSSCQAASHDVSGRLNVESGGFFSTNPGLGRHRIAPKFSVDLVQVEGRVIPVQPGIIRSENASEWDVVIGNGLVWSEPEDGGKDRVTLPVHLTHEKWNAVHNGVMTFLFDGDSTSAIYWQFAQETATWDRYDYWTRSDASWSALEADTNKAVERQYRLEMATAIPTRPLNRVPGATPDALDDFNRGLPTPAQISQAGVVVDDVLYTAKPITRYGVYPFPEQMRHGVFSVTKTIAATVSLLYLAERYGQDVFQERIVDYIDIPAAHNGWDNVTFEHALSMMTGIGDNFPDPNANRTFADENDGSVPAIAAFAAAQTRAELISAIALNRNYPWGPGEIVRYNTNHHVALSAALEQYLRQKEGPDADLWELLHEDVYQPLGIRWISHMRSREPAGDKGLIYIGYGVVATMQDLAKVALLLQNDGVHQGKQLLHAQMTRAALQKDGVLAFPTSNWNQFEQGDWFPVTYRYGVWSTEFNYNGCSGIASSMEGYGGNFVVMMPSGVTLIRLADHDVFDAGAMMLTGERIRSSCH